jgi:pimeloyl-ACP methyl ester carboxylesterase
MPATIILVHGAYAESSSWNQVIETLSAAGHHVIAYANPLRSIASDAAGLTELVRTIDGPILLVGHSYGGAVITNVAADAGEIIGLVYVAGFALESGESPADAAALAPGGTLAETLQTVPLPDGSMDTYISPEKFHHQFCADVPEHQAMLMAVTQRPITEAALNELAADHPLWKATASWFIFGSDDHNIPAGSHRIMAERAHAAQTVEISGASHAVGVSHPMETATLILDAARSPSPLKL